MDHFRDSRPGRFYAHDDSFDAPLPPPNETPAFLRFARRSGVAVDLWRDTGLPVGTAIEFARLDWPVIRREVVVPSGPGLREPSEARHYKALVRPDTAEVMSVVTNLYSVAENEWVATATEHFAGCVEQGPSLLGAVGFGRCGERTMFAARVLGGEDRAVCLLSYNTHGGEGAVKFQVVEVERLAGVTCVLDSPHATLSLPHVGDLRDRLERKSQPWNRNTETFVQRYLAETQPLWKHLEDTMWTRRHTTALVRELWGDTPDEKVASPDGRIEVSDRINARHPGHHLPDLMARITEAASAYRAVCDWIDNRSEACERGDFTKDRDERLALGAGNKYKRNAWRWILDHA